MKIQIDTTNKTIVLLETTNLKELFSELDLMLPSEEWKDYTIGIPIFMSPSFIPYNPQPYWDQHPITEPLKIKWQRK